MRPILSTALLAALVALSVSACSSSSSSAADSSASSAATDSSATSSAADNGAMSSATDNGASSSAASDNMASSAPAAAGAPPVYPGATAATAAKGLGLSALPKSAKIYMTADDFAKVKGWYKAQLKGAQEAAQPGKEKTMDAFLVGQGPSGMVVMVQSLNGKTWIVIGPPM